MTIAWILAAGLTVSWVSFVLSSHKGWRTIGPPVTGMLIMSVLANLGAVPPGSAAPDFYAQLLAVLGPAAAFLMILETRLRDIAAAGKPMLLLFGAGVAGVMAGAFLAATIYSDSKIAGDRVAPLAGMLAAGFTGGTVNLNAMAVHYGFGQDARFLATVVAIENLAKGFWILVTTLVPMIFMVRASRAEVDGANSVPEGGFAAAYPARRISLSRLSVLLFLTGATLGLAELLTRWLRSSGIDFPAILLTTTIAIMLASVMPRGAVSGAAVLGRWVVCLFLVFLGAQIELELVRESIDAAAVMLKFAAIILVVHAIFTTAAAVFLKASPAAASIASSACVGGVSSVTALASTCGRSDLLTPGILLAILGNAVGTWLGFLVVALA